MSIPPDYGVTSYRGLAGLSVTGPAQIWDLYAADPAAGGLAAGIRGGPPSWAWYAPQPGIVNNDVNINQLLATIGHVKLAPGQYPVTGPVNVPDGAVFESDYCQVITPNDFSGVSMTNGAVLQPAGAYTGANGVIQFSATSSSSGRVVRNIVIDATAIEHNTPVVHGIYSTGPVYGAVLDGVLIYKPSGYGIYTDNTGGAPDSWFVFRCKVSHAVGAAGIWANIADTWWIGVESSEGGTATPTDGWLVGGAGGNQRFIGCKGENNGGYGWNVNASASDQPMSWTDCGAQINAKSGWFFRGGTNSTILSLANCRSDNDGGVADAGLLVSGCASRIQVVNFQALSELGYGCWYGSSSFELSCVNCYWGAAVAATHDDGSNTHALVNANPLA